MYLTDKRNRKEAGDGLRKINRYMSHGIGRNSTSARKVNVNDIVARLKQNNIPLLRLRCIDKITGECQIGVPKRWSHLFR